jgi:replicative DNA helicase
MGNGKTTFMLSQMQYLADHGMATLYLPLEVDVEDVRRRWAAWSLGLDWKLVARNEIAPEGRHALEEMIATQSRIRHVQFPEDQRVSLDRLEELTRWGVDKIGATCIVVDHLHRMEFGGVGANYRVLVTEAVRRLKDLARKYKVTILATAQLNQDGAQLDRYFPPTIRRLKESAGIGEEADVVLMLSRCLKHAIDGETMRLIQSGMASERDYEATNKMRVTCRKHRLDDSARDRSVALMVDNGKLRDCWYGEAG